jgi:peptidyl-prolyl cis-trans isomerase SurA
MSFPAPRRLGSTLVLLTAVAATLGLPLDASAQTEPAAAPVVVPAAPDQGPKADAARADVAPAGTPTVAPDASTAAGTPAVNAAATAPVAPDVPPPATAPAAAVMPGAAETATGPAAAATPGAPPPSNAPAAAATPGAAAPATAPAAAAPGTAEPASGPVTAVAPGAPLPVAAPAAAATPSTAEPATAPAAAAAPGAAEPAAAPAAALAPGAPPPAAASATPGATAPTVAAPAAPPSKSATASSPSESTTRLLDRIVAIVNDEVLTNGELEYRIHLAQTQLERSRIARPPADVLRRQILERLILDRAQLQLAKESGVRVDDGTVNSAIGRMAEQNGMNLQAMRTKVEADGVSFNQFREDMRDEITMMRLRDREVDSKIQISEGEIDNFLQEQASITSSTVEYDVAQILIGVPEIASPEYVERARRRAEDLYAQIRNGADFARLAAGYSAAPEALQGGDLGWRSLDRLPGLFADAIRTLKPGEVAPLVRSPVGFHILKLLGQRDAAKARISNKPVAQTHARHILLRVTDILPEAEIKHRLVDLRERIIGGQDFGELARLYSVDPSSTRGGDLGWLYPNDTVPAFETAMNALKINEISEPVQSPFGWHLIQVLERRTEESSIERKRLEARQALRDRKSEEALQEWLRQLRDRTYVEYRLEDNRL